MSGPAHMPIFKVTSSSAASQSGNVSLASTTTTVTVTSSTSTASRMLVPAVLIPSSDGSGPSFAQFLPASSSNAKNQSGGTSPNIQPFIISGVPSGTQHHQASSSVLGLLTPVLSSASLATTSLIEDAKKKNVSSPPPLQPITATQHQIISLNKLKHMGGINQFKRIQPYPTPAPPPPPADSTSDQSVLRVQIKQGNFGEFRSYAGKNANAKDAESEKKILKDRSSVSIAKEAMSKLKETESVPLNEFPNLITIHGLTSQRPVSTTSSSIETTHCEETAEVAKVIVQEIPPLPLSPPINVRLPVSPPEIVPDSTQVVPTVTTEASPIVDPPSTDNENKTVPTIEEPLSVDSTIKPDNKPKVKEEDVNQNSENKEKPLEKCTEETDSNKSEEECFTKRRQFKRPSILGGRKKFSESSPILASTLKKVANVNKKCITPDLSLKKEVVDNKVSINEKVDESKQATQTFLADVKPPNIDDKVAEDFDATKALDWQDGVGVLPGSNLKFKMNEFGIMEMVETDDDNKDVEHQKIGNITQLVKTEIKSEATEEAVKKPAVPEVRKRARKEKLSPDDIYCCENCGCYGMACEFKTQRFCSDTCEEATSRRRAAIGRRAMELEELKAKRRKKRQQDQQSKQKTNQESGEETNCSTPEVSTMPDSQESRDKAGTPATSATPSSTAQNSPSQTPAGSDDETNMSEDQMRSQAPLLPWQVFNSNGEALFSWPKYLEHLKARAAPTKLFPDGGFPYQRNGFRPGMRLEGIDPRMPSQFCALSIADVKGYRIKLHFEGWPDTNDFWVNADSRDIFVVGFCEKSGRSLIPPRGYPKTTFSWTSYLKLLRASAAPRQQFLHRPTTKNAVGPSGFRVGMKLEAVDKQNQDLICVATVADILDGRLLVHFDSWDHTYDYWVEPTSPYIHPVGWCDQNKRTLTPPNGYLEFNWDTYLKDTKSSAVPSRAFKPKTIPAFKKGMKLECVDPRFPDLIRVATINDCRRHRVQVSFDGWPLETAVWMDCDSPDIHPMGWCNKTGHPLTAPPGPNQEHYCITPGCRALLKNSQLILPHSCNSCPLTAANLANVGKSKKLPVRDHIAPVAAKPRVESSEGEDFRPDTEEEEDFGAVDEKQESPPKKKKIESNMKSLRLDVHESIFSPGYVPSPAELPLNWSKHAHLLNIENKKPLNNRIVRTWSPQQVQNFVSSLPGCEERSKAFIEEKIDGESLLLLTQSDLIGMLGFKVGPAIKLYSSITLLKNKKQQQA